MDGASHKESLNHKIHSVHGAEKGLSKKVDKSLETLVKALTPRLMLGCSLLVMHNEIL